MNSLMARIFSKLYWILFTCYYSWSLKAFGSGTAIYRPFRIDGGKDISLGSKTIFQRGSWLYCLGIDEQSATLTIGAGCVFGYNNHITSVREVVIGDYVLTANNVYISDNIHGYEDIHRPIIKQPVKFKQKVEIGDGCWIGENACIIGSRVGKNSVIGANAVVTSDIPDYAVAVGIPARVIKIFDMDLGKWVSLPNI
jgi:acetyltransferase-like isoleucine patch superfamily enzyme